LTFVHYKNNDVNIILIYQILIVTYFLNYYEKYVIIGYIMFGCYVVLTYFMKGYNILNFLKSILGLIPTRDFIDNIDYVDYQNHLYIRAKKLILKLGYLGGLLFSEMDVGNIKKETMIFSIKYETYIKPKTNLPKQCYSLIPLNGLSNFKILNLDFFRKEKINNVYVVFETPIDIKEYCDNITVNYDKKNKCIHVFNENDIEIRDYLLRLPRGISFEDIKDVSKQIVGVMPGQLKSNYGDNIILKKIEPRTGSKAGEVMLLLH